MGFVAISIDKYIKMYLKNNPSDNEKDLSESLCIALSNYQKGVKCSCGNDIWVIGSASMGNSCFTCITDESYPDNDYEIESAIKKRESAQGRRHIDEIERKEIHGFFTYDGYEINTDLIMKPPICLTCIHDDDPKEEGLCVLNRYDQRNSDEFVCYKYGMSSGPGQ
ncbi:MAG: hypothetical protein AB9842_05510 [Bacteroidales bacterium]